MWRAGPLYRLVRGVVNQPRRFVLRRFATNLLLKTPVVRFFDRRLREPDFSRDLKTRVPKSVDRAAS